MPRVVILTSSLGTNPLQEVAQRNMITALKAKGYAFDEVDGLQPENKDRRNALFECSGLKGKYPQVFIQTSETETTFVGDGEAFNELLEMDDVPAEVLSANPDIKTFTSTFAECDKA